MTFDELYLDKTSRVLLEAYRRQPQQGLLLSGVRGVGLGTIAQTLAREVVAHPTDIVTVTPDEAGTISIETVRSLYVTTRDARQTKQVMIVDDIDAMSHDAQNAFLKLLEEPTDMTYFIATTHQLQLVLPTILSRTQGVDIRPINDQDTQQLLSARRVVDASTVRQLMFLASGRPAELHRLIDDQELFTRSSQFVVDARAILSGSPYDRLVRLAAYNDRSAAQQLVRTLAQIVAFSLVSTSNERLVASAEVLEQTLDNLAHNGHVRTQLMAMAERL